MKPLGSRHSVRPCLEVLEDRTLLSTYFVTLATDNTPNGGGQKDNTQANSGDLRWCLTQADTSKGNTIIFTSNVNNNPINLVAALPQITQDMTIQPAQGGLGYGSLTGNPVNATVQRSDAQGTPDFRIFDIAAGKNVTLGAFTIQNGELTTDNGAGIYNQGTLTLNGTDIAGNVTTGGDGGGVYNTGVLNLNNGARIDGVNKAASGGGIYNLGTVTATGRGLVNFDTGQVTWLIPVVAADQATNGDGGGIYNAAAGILTLNRMEIYNNTASGNGGGIYNAANGGLTLQNSTLRNNSATNGEGGGLYNAGLRAAINQNTFNNNSAGLKGGAIRNVGLGAKGNGNTVNGNKVTGVPGQLAANETGGGISNDSTGSFSLVNSIVAGNTAPTDNDVEGTFTDLGHNFIGDGTGGNFQNGVNYDQVGSSSQPLNPMLGPLQDNGGGIDTELPAAGSPVIDTGDNSEAMSGDARNFVRIINNIIDIGAVEYNSSPITLAAPFISLNSSANPATPTQAVTFTATVSGSNGTPTGSVDFWDGSTLLGTGVLDGNGNATLTTSALSLGNQVIVAIYSGDDTYASTTATLTQTVEPITSSTALGSNNMQTQPGQPVTFTATVTGSGSTPTGTVTFLNGTTTLATVTLDGNGIASYTTSTLPSGRNVITAVYSGDATYTASSFSMFQTVGSSALGDPAVFLTSSANSVTIGQSVTFTANVSGGSPTPTGTVTFLDGTTVLDTATLDGNGNASFSTADLALGVHDIIAIYSGDSNYSGNASSAPLMENIVQAASTTSLSSSANPSPSGQAVTFTATVAASGSGEPAPTGSVAFYDGTTLLGTGILTLVNGQWQASFTTSALEAGTHNITAIYSGDDTFADSASSLEQTISS